MKTIVRILMTAAAVMLLANFANAQQHICFSDVTNELTYDAETLQPLSTVEWSMSAGGGTIDDINAESITIDWEDVVAGDYTLTLTENHVSELCSEIATLTITVHTAPTATFAVETSTACDGLLGEVIVNVVSDSEWTLSYEIDDVAQADIVSSDASYDFAPNPVDAVMKYDIIAISNLGCTGSLGAFTTHTVTPIVLGPTIGY